ncbi:MAG: prenyltransferase/squalene oxidase repeat-containing protein [Solirubrobacteraceae bacterium]
MSWQLASFIVVLGSLGLAFWWYERSRPPTKLLAVIATLAALAALGRDAFAAVPDVKPITAIVLISGFAFGAAPGFAVGAIAGLASNVLLGEGPWTPWQMLGWGVVGLMGAVLARLLHRRASPLVLALACAAGAEIFNLILDVYSWTGTGNHTLAGFVVVLGTAVVFDVTHVLASFGFGLAFGGVMLRMLERVRIRLEVRWEPPSGEASRVSPSHLVPLCALALALVALSSPNQARAAGTSSPIGPTSTATAARVSIAREISYLAAAQNSDGGFGGAKGQTSSELYSAWAALGLAAAGRNPLSLRRSGHTVLDAIRLQAGSLQGAGDLERTILALRACGVSVHVLPGGDPVARLLRTRAADGSFEHLGNLTAFGIFALRAAGYRATSQTVRRAGGWLARQQDADGGFGFATRGGGSDVDDTSAALQALIDAGVRSGPVPARAVAFLVRAQNLDGGYPQELGGESNAQSSAFAIQALIAAGHDVNTVKRQGSRSPLAYIESLLAPDGSVRYSRTGAQTPVWVTAQALTAIAGKPFPISPVSRGRTAALPGETRMGRIASALAAALAPVLGGLSGAL